MRACARERPERAHVNGELLPRRVAAEPFEEGVVRGAREPVARAKARTLLVAAAVPTILTLAFEWATGIAPSNGWRALAGVPLGAALVWMVLQAEVN